MWGTHKPAKDTGFTVGITPTCVGNTEDFASMKQGSEDHPHLCGEHKYYITAIK